MTFQPGDRVIYNGLLRGREAQHIGIVDSVSTHAVRVDFGYTDVPILRFNPTEARLEKQA